MIIIRKKNKNGCCKKLDIKTGTLLGFKSMEYCSNCKEIISYETYDKTKKASKAKINPEYNSYKDLNQLKIE